MNASISVIIPAYNAAAFLRDAVDSACRQSLQPLEILVVNDGSTDDTGAIASSYPPPVRCLTRENGGLAAARNTGIEAARGEWLAFLDADDLWPEDHLAAQMEAAAAQQAGFIFSDARVVTPTSEFPSWMERAGHGWLASLSQPGFGDVFNRLLRRGSFALPSSVMVRRDAVLRAGGFDESMRPGPEDLDLWLRLDPSLRWAFNRRTRIVRAEHDGNLTGNRFGMAQGAEKLWLKTLRNPPTAAGRDQLRIIRLRLAEAQWEQAYWGLRTGRRLEARQAARRSLHYRWRWRAALYWGMAILPEFLTASILHLRRG